jgi:hypothetical protein
MNSIVAKALAWLRAGYPTGVPRQDYQPILALLRRRLTAEEVQEVANALLSQTRSSPSSLSRRTGWTRASRS